MKLRENITFSLFPFLFLALSPNLTLKSTSVLIFQRNCGTHVRNVPFPLPMNKTPKFHLIVVHWKRRRESLSSYVQGKFK